MYKVDLEKAEKPEIKLPTFAGSWRKQGDSRKTSTASLTTLKPLTVWITKNWKIQEMGIPGHLIFLLRTCLQVKKQQLELDMEQWTDSKLGKDFRSRLYTVTVLI